MVKEYLAFCGASFCVQDRVRTKWPLLVALVGAVLAIFVSITNLYIIPFVIWAAIMMRLEHTAQTPSFIAVSRSSVRTKDASVDFAELAEVCVERGAIVLGTATRAVRIDLHWLAAPRLRMLARHLEARMLLARGRERTRAEQAALEAFHVFGANAVRMHKRVVVELLEGDGPWLVAPQERVYVRHLPVDSEAYRTNARTVAIPLGELA
jgi:hypothetical protein